MDVLVLDEVTVAVDVAVFVFVLVTVGEAVCDDVLV